MLSTEQKKILLGMAGLVAVATGAYLLYPISALWNTVVFSSLLTAAFAFYSLANNYLNGSLAQPQTLIQAPVTPSQSINQHVNDNPRQRHLSNFQVENVSLIKKFMGQSDERHDLRNFEEWYPQSIVETLMAGQSNPSGALRVVFSNPAAFIEELTQFKMMLNTLQRPGIFVSMEPGAGQNHYIIGIIHKNSLLLINPVGTTQHKDFYETVDRLRAENVFPDIILSTTSIQKDPEGLVSCGPLCTQLSNQFSQSNFETLFANIQGQAQAHPRGAYKTMDIMPLLGDPLRRITMASIDAYQGEIRALRQRHLDELMQVCQDKTSLKECNDHFDNALDSNENILLRNLVLAKASIIDMLDMPEFKALQAQRTPQRLKPQ